MSAACKLFISLEELLHFRIYRFTHCKMTVSFCYHLLFEYIISTFTIAFRFLYFSIIKLCLAAIVISSQTNHAILLSSHYNFVISPINSIDS